jgi:uncharacterized protein YndB with AHSA1/START domain
VVIDKPIEEVFDLLVDGEKTSSPREPGPG